MDLERPVFDVKPCATCNVPKTLGAFRLYPSGRRGDDCVRCLRLSKKATGMPCTQSGCRYRSVTSVGLALHLSKTHGVTVTDRRALTTDEACKVTALRRRVAPGNNIDSSGLVDLILGAA